MQEYLKKLAETEADIREQCDLAQIDSYDKCWTTGAGKSATAARLLAELFATRGVSAGFIHAGDLLHGGMGRIQLRDILIVFSQDANTKELAEAVSVLLHRDRRCRVMLVTASEHGSIDYHDRCFYPKPPRGHEALPQVLVAGILAETIAPGFADWAHPANRSTDAN